MSRKSNRMAPTTRRDPRRGAAKFVRRVAQRAQLLVLFAADDLVRANDLFAGEHVVLRRRRRSGERRRAAIPSRRDSATIVG